MDTIIRHSTITQQFLAIRTQTVQLCAPLKPEDFVAQPVDYVSPPKWHLGHTSWFFETFLLIPYQKGYKMFESDYGFIFNSYYESEGERIQRANRGTLTRPTIEDVLAYRTYVDNAMGELLIANEQLPQKVKEILTIGLHHEQQHQELLVYDIKYILGTNPLFPPYLNEEDTQQNAFHTITSNNREDYITIEEGLYTIGHEGDGFCFDNELGRHRVFLQRFQIQNRLTTNREYLAFMEAGGYKQFQYWLSEGWQWVQENNIKSPLYWHFRAGTWYHYTLHGLKKVNLDEPVTHISFYEAEAFTQWKGQRLPTESEWEVACNTLSKTIPNEANMLEKNVLSPQRKSGDNLQFYGDCWEWTSSAYRPYPYFKTTEGALGEYNGKFMINQMVLRGGSCATPRNHIRASYRNFFHPHMRWAITGLRLAKDL